MLSAVNHTTEKTGIQNEYIHLTEDYVAMRSRIQQKNRFSLQKNTVMSRAPRSGMSVRLVLVLLLVPPKCNGAAASNHNRKDFVVPTCTCSASLNTSWRLMPRVFFCESTR